MTNIEKIAGIIESNHGYITHKDMERNQIPTSFLYVYAKDNGLIKQTTGFYSKADWIADPYLLFQYRYPKFAFSFNSSLALNSLTDSIPSFLEVTAPKNYRPYSPKDKEKAIIHTDTKEKTYLLGLTTAKTVYMNIIRTYDMEKTICDIIRFKKQVDTETYSKALRLYIKRKDKDLKKLMDYAKLMDITKKVQTIIELLA